MKLLISLFAFIALASTGFAQSTSQLEQAASGVFSGTGRPTNSDGIILNSTLSRGIIGLNNRLSLKTASDGALAFTNTTNNFYYKLSLPTPTANRTVSWPIGGGTLVTTPTTLEWQFTGATYNTVLTQVEPTVGSTVITLPDTANVDVSLVLSTLTTNGLHVANSVWLASNSIVGEGTTGDAFETTISFGEPTADQTLTLPNLAVNGAFVMSTLTTNTIDAANSIWFASNALKLEGTTADGFEITISPVDPTADATWSIPNFAVDAAFVGSTLTTNNVDAANSVWGVSNALRLEGTTADTSETTVTLVDPTADRTITLPDASGTVQVFIAEDVTATNAIAAIENGSVFYLNAATEFVSTLPAPFLGGHFTFIVKAAPSGADYTIVTTTSANVVIGNQNSVAGDAGDFGTADDTISFVGGQSVAGDKVEVFSDGTSWFAYAISKVAAGVTFTQATP